MVQPRMLVTGSTDGIGKAAAVELAKKGAAVIVHGRTEQKAEAARKEIAAASDNPGVEAVAGDFSSLSEVRRMAEAMRAHYDRLDVLINNAGVVSKTRMESADGYELTFAVNHLAPFLLTNLLLPLLKESAPTRIVVVSSMVHSGADLDLSDLQMERGYSAQAAYSRSKLANLLFSGALARRLSGSGVTVNALHPGVISTKLLHASFSGGSAPEDGAQTPVYLATSPDVANVSGRYFVNKTERAPSATAQDEELQERLWKISAELTGLSG